MNGIRNLEELTKLKIGIRLFQIEFFYPDIAVQNIVTLGL
jgi:hypothetical protein